MKPGFEIIERGTPVPWLSYGVNDWENRGSIRIDDSYLRFLPTSQDVWDLRSLKTSRYGSTYHGR